MKETIRSLWMPTAGTLTGARRVAMLLLTLLLTMTTQTAWADNVTLSVDNEIDAGTAGYYYYNMPGYTKGNTVHHTLTISEQDITDGKATFKVYDNGGKGDNYGYTIRAYLTITAPEGKVVKVSGPVTTYNDSDFLYIYDGTDNNASQFLNGSSKKFSGNATVDVLASSNSITLYFETDKWAGSIAAGLNLTVEINDPTVYAKDISRATVTGMKSLYSHTGSAISLGYTVTPFKSSTPLTKGTDYTETITKGGATVTNVIDEGNYTLTITGKDPYYGSQSFDFTVGDYIPMTNTTTVMNNCLYGVKENITISNRIVVIGDVTLTLEEGCTLTAQQGIQVTAGNTLTIDGTGSLTIQWGSEHSAGIGSGENEEYGHIIINGGTINTEGNSYGAGIGGGYQNPDNGNCCITINGGIINASGGQSAAGIGGGYWGSAGKIVINGGQVTARAGHFGGCGIGKGYASNDAKGLLTLDWTRESDFVDVDEYNISNINFVGKDFVLDEDNTITATTYNIAGKKIVPKLDNLVLNHATMNNLCSLYRYTGSEIALDYIIKSTDGVTTLVKGTDYSETIKKGDETVTMVKDKGEYTLTITGLGDYYTGTKSYTFSVADIDENLTQDGNEYYVNLPSDGSTKTVCLGENQTIKVYDSEGKNGSLVTCDGYLLLQAPDGYALEVWGKTDAMKYNAVANELTNSLAAYEGNTTDNEIITLQSNSDDIMFASSKNVMLIRLNVPKTYSYNNAAQYGLDLTVKVIQQQPYSITKGDALNGSISIADNKATALTNETITLEVNPADGYLLKRVIITDTDNGQAIKTIGEDFWYSGKNTVSFKMPNRNITLTPEFDNNMTTAAGWAININSEGTSECVIPENIQSFNLSVSAPRNGENSRYITVILNAHDGFYLQATGNVDFDPYGSDWSEFGIYDGSGTSSPSAQLTNIQAINKDSNNEDVSIGTQTSSSNYMTFYLEEFSIHDSQFTGTIETKLKNYNITYDLAGGSIATDANPTTYNYKTDAFTLTNPTRKNYTFAGWTGTGLDAASTSVTIDKSTGDRSYTATWNIITYNITYNGVDGATFETANPTTYTVEDAITLNNPGKDGYEFAGWYDNEGFAGSAITGVAIAKGSTGDKTFWAKWTRPITSEGITISIPSQEWTGSALTPVITVTDGTTTLNEGTDYTVTAPSGTIQNAGDYTYTITGAGNYDGTTTKTFTITPKVLEAHGAINVCQDQNGTTATLDGASEGGFSITGDMPVEKVILSRTFESGKKTTVCWPFAVSDTEAAALGKFYQFKSINGEGKIEMEEVTTGLEANTPYIYEPSSGKTEIEFGAKTLKAGGPKSVGSGFTFKGIDKRVKWTTVTTDPLYDATLAGELGKAYGFALKDITVGTTAYQKGQFVMLGSGANSRAFRAYLLSDGTWDGQQPAVGAARTRSAASSLPDVIDIVWIPAQSRTTGISTVGAASETDGWYSLDGRKLDGKPTKKGLYINNGKKVVIK